MERETASAVDLAIAVDSLRGVIRRLDNVLDREPPFSDRRFKLLDLQLQLRSLQRELEHA